MFTADIITDSDDAILTEIILINSRAFPPEWEDTDARSYYKAKLMDIGNINIVLKTNGTRIGYLLAIPHDDAVAELRVDDPAMEEDDGKYYIETVSILPEHRGQGGALILVEKLIEECKRRNCCSISLHARVTNGFSRFIQSHYKITQVRRIENWKYYNYEEPTDYVDVSFCSDER